MGYCAAFAIEVDSRDQLVVVQEVEPRQRNLDTSAAIQAIRTAIAIRHELEVYAVVLVKAGMVPKTSSGKTQRTACRERYLQGTLEILAAWTAAVDELENEPDRVASPLVPRQVSAEEIEAWLIERITTRLRLAPGDIQISTPFLELGMGSLDATEIAAALERWLGRQLSPTAIYNYPTIAALARWLATLVIVGDADRNTSANLSPYSSITLAAAPKSADLLAEVRAMSDHEMEGFLAQQVAQQQQKE